MPVEQRRDLGGHRSTERTSGGHEIADLGRGLDQLVGCRRVALVGEALVGREIADLGRGLE